jgi:hypothetical protein
MDKRYGRTIASDKQFCDLELHGTRTIPKTRVVHRPDLEGDPLTEASQRALANVMVGVRRFEVSPPETRHVVRTPSN